MKVFIVGAGRSGTNLLLEILSGSSKLNVSSKPENKNLFKTPKKYPEGYLTKCDTKYVQNVQGLLSLNPDYKIFFTIRHPFDMVLSKIYRGQSGHDNDNLASDATFEGCVEDLYHMVQIYNRLPEVKVVKMENIILDFKHTVSQVCDYLGIPYEEQMENFISRMRNEYKRQRYKNLDKTQIGLYKSMAEIYGGFFSNRDRLLNTLRVFDKVYPIVKKFGYER